MARTQSSDFLERITPQVRTGGARNIVELAKALRIPVETTRYKVNGMLKRGLSIHASVDYTKFGLVNHQVTFLLGQRAIANEKKFFQSLSESAYLTSYAREFPSNLYVCWFAAPSSTGLSRLIRGLSEERLIEDPSVASFSWKKSHMIRPSYFQLKKGVWSVDWNKVRRESIAEDKRGSAASFEFDDLDLMIARILEEDALRKLSEIATTLKTTLNNVFYHFHKHILGGKLIDEFVIRWDGSQRQDHVLIQMEFEDLGIAQEKNAKASIRRLPYLWSDSLSLETGAYIGEAMIPISQSLQVLRYLSETLGETARKLKVRFFDPSTRQQFPIPAHLYRNGSWQFDPDACVNVLTSKIRK